MRAAQPAATCWPRPGWGRERVRGDSTAQRGLQLFLPSRLAWRPQRGAASITPCGLGCCCAEQRFLPHALPASLPEKVPASPSPASQLLHRPGA